MKLALQVYIKLNLKIEFRHQRPGELKFAADKRLVAEFDLKKISILKVSILK